MALSFLNDTLAYFSGKHLGKKKWNEPISPKKTWAGYWGGVAASVVTAVVFGLFIANNFHERHLAQWLILGLVVGLIGPNGDLVESVFKRSKGLKDSGIFLPGHGGLWDRIDALIWVLPLVYFFRELI